MTLQTSSLFPSVSRLSQSFHHVKGLALTRSALESTPNMLFVGPLAVVEEHLKTAPLEARLLNDLHLVPCDIAISCANDPVLLPSFGTNKVSAIQGANISVLPFGSYPEQYFCVWDNDLLRKYSAAVANGLLHDLSDVPITVFPVTEKECFSAAALPSLSFEYARKTKDLLELFVKKQAGAKLSLADIGSVIHEIRTPNLSASDDAERYVLGDAQLADAFCRAKRLADYVLQSYEIRNIASIDALDMTRQELSGVACRDLPPVQSTPDARSTAMVLRHRCTIASDVPSHEKSTFYSVNASSTRKDVQNFPHSLRLVSVAYVPVNHQDTAQLLAEEVVSIARDIEYHRRNVR